jgi:hypothetical protein
LRRFAAICLSVAIVGAPGFRWGRDYSPSPRSGRRLLVFSCGIFELLNFFPDEAIATLAKQSSKVATILRDTNKRSVPTRLG